MTREEAIKEIYGFSGHYSADTIEDTFSKKITLLESKKESLGTAIYTERLTKLQEAKSFLADAEHASINLEELPSGKKVEVKKERPKIVTEGEEVSSIKEQKASKKSKKKKGFVEALLHPVIFFLVLGSVAFAIFATTKWLKSKSKISELEVVEQRFENAKKALNNQQFKLLNAGDETIAITYYFVVYYDEESQQMKKYENVEPNLQLRGNMTNPKAIDAKGDLYDGRVLFFYVEWVDVENNYDQKSFFGDVNQLNNTEYIIINK